MSDETNEAQVRATAALDAALAREARLREAVEAAFAPRHRFTWEPARMPMPAQVEIALADHSADAWLAEKLAEARVQGVASVPRCACCAGITISARCAR